MSSTRSARFGAADKRKRNWPPRSNGSLALADELELASIAFPAISTGIFGFPKELAASIFMRTIPAYFVRNSQGTLKSVSLVLYDSATLSVFSQEFTKEFNLD